ncbi:WXG100 family type VII secretion target [Mycolicibacterium helvum]|uniref:WXG100 family type VII secretion target n=1 Tax=Mycolicibacterium helvum TaxID=1534349 RepID=A0A7I7T4T7_9MYCO|nr:WXG100 family type VII secretion target [Mycolicibacterium helvum]BBY63126.1 hypothetical protein MHEL_13690 [Mycolicibacterium helvum]
MTVCPSVDITGGTPERLSVDLDALTQSATNVTGHGDDLQASQTGASTRISAATGGWRGTSAQALANRMAKWNIRTTELVTAVGEHAQSLHTCATVFAANEQANSQNLRDVASQLPNST